MGGSVSSSDLSSWCCWAAALVAPPSGSRCRQRGHELRRWSSPPQTWESRWAHRADVFFSITINWTTEEKPTVKLCSSTIAHITQTSCFVGDQQCFTGTAPQQRHHSPRVSELRIDGGEPHEELVLQLQRSLSEDGGRPVVQSRRPANVKQ